MTLLPDSDMASSFHTLFSSGQQWNRFPKHSSFIQMMPVCHQPFTTDGQVKTETTPHGICDAQCGIETGFSHNTLVFQSVTFLHSITYYQF